MKKIISKAYEGMTIKDPEIVEIAEDVSNELDSFEKINLFIAYTYFDPEDFTDFFADADKLLTSTERQTDKSTEGLDKFKSQILTLIKKLDDAQIEQLLEKYGFEDLYDPTLAMAADTLEKQLESNSNIKKFKILSKMQKAYEAKWKSNNMSNSKKLALSDRTQNLFNDDTDEIQSTNSSALMPPKGSQERKMLGKKLQNMLGLPEGAIEKYEDDFETKKEVVGALIMKYGENFKQLIPKILEHGEIDEIKAVYEKFIELSQAGDIPELPSNTLAELGNKLGENSEE